MTTEGDIGTDLFLKGTPQMGSLKILLYFLADPPSGGVSSRFTHVRLSVCACVRNQLTKLFDVYGSR